MIRFSAALVVVSIGVLVGGVVTSSLMLVYMAIGLSVGALAALAIGVVLKRQELFGEPGQSAGGDGAASTQPALVTQGANAGQAGFGPERLGSAAFGEPFGEQGTFGHAAHQRPEASAAQQAGASVAPQTTWAAAPDVLSGRHPGSFGSDDQQPAPPWRERFAPPVRETPVRETPRPAAQTRADLAQTRTDLTETRTDLTESKADPAPGWPAPNWFDRTAAARTDGEAPRDGNEGESGGRPPADEPVAEADEPVAEAGSEPESPADASAEGEAGDDVTADDVTADDTGARAADVAAADVAEDVAAEDVTAGEATAEDNADAAEDAKDAKDADDDADVEDDADVPDARDAGADEVGADEVGADEVSAEDAGAAADTAGKAAAEAADGPASAGEDGVTGQREVTVVPGVPRYHDGSCILIRFMGDDDMQKMTLDQATEAGCTPCRACMPA